MEDHENTAELVSDFYNHLNQKVPHSMEEEEHFITLIEAVFFNIDEMVSLIFFDTEIDDENIPDYRNKLLEALQKNFTQKLLQPYPISSKASNIEDSEHLEEGGEKFAVVMAKINTLIQS